VARDAAARVGFSPGARRPAARRQTAAIGKDVDVDGFQFFGGRSASDAERGRLGDSRLNGRPEGLRYQDRDQYRDRADDDADAVAQPFRGDWAQLDTNSHLASFWIGQAGVASLGLLVIAGLVA